MVTVVIGLFILLLRELISVENVMVQSYFNIVLLPFLAIACQSIRLFKSYEALADTLLSLPIGVLLAGNQIRLPVSTAFIPALPIDDQSLQ